MQSRKHSILESVTNIAVGFLMSLAMQSFLMHMYGIKTSFKVDLQITLWFTVLSFVRSYVLRRVFNRMSKKA